jgi:serine/threonine-protein kinase
MGIAYLASHPVLKMPMVVKTFTVAEDDLFREAHLAARVLSPFVVDVVDAGFDDGAPFIITRYVDGLDLSELLQRFADMRETLPIEVVIHILADVARGLHSIHQTGVIHRDIKPENLFLSGAGVALVGDFGIAVDPSRGVESSHLAGTPHYIPPEMWGRDTIDARADVYSLGATAHHVATGEPPFAAHSLSAIAHAHTELPYEPPDTADPEEAYLFAAIKRMLAKSPDDRFISAGEVARTLAPLARPLPPVRLTGRDTAEFGALHVGLTRGDLTELEADVLVNAANGELSMNVGVAAALRRKGGEAIQREALAAAPVAMGDVVWTTAGALSAQWVAHAVAALEGAVCLQRCALRVLLGARARGATSVIFPALGTGVGKVPMALGAKLVLEAIRTFAWLGPGSIEWVGIVLVDDVSLHNWRAVLGSL